MNAIDYLNTELSLDTTNRFRAIEDAGQLAFNPDTYRRIIGELSGAEEVAVKDDYAKHTFMYLVDNIITGLPGKAALEVAVPKAAAFVESHPWVLAKPEVDYQPTSKVDALGEPKQKKGAKKSAAITFWKENQGNFETRKEWLDALMENVGLTKGAASTYHHNLKKGLW